MFILIGSYYLNGPGTGASAGVAQGFGATPGLDAGGRSTLTEPILPAPVACSSSHAGHAAMH